jgi:hypothetical protein
VIDRHADGHRVSTDGTRWSPPADSAAPLIGSSGPRRDIGSSCGFTPRGAASSDVGVGIGFYYTCDQFGFRRQPFAVRQTIGFGYSTGPGGINGSYQIQVRPIESNLLFGVRLYGTSAEWTRFFGYGNNTSLTQDGIPHSINYFQVRENRFQIYPSVMVPLAQGLTLQLGPELRYWDTGHTSGTLFALAQPYGAGPFGTIDGRGELRYDSRDAVGLPTKGWLIDVVGRGVPGVWDAQSTYGSVRGQAATYLTPSGLPGQPTLALRVGGMKVWGDAPYQDMAHIGATQSADDPFTVRGFYPDRFTGDAAVWENTQVYFTIAHPKILIPSDVGLLLLNDVGRVFYPGENSSQWHDAYGGGAFVSVFRRAVSLVAVAAHSSERTLFYLGAGTGF